MTAQVKLIPSFLTGIEASIACKLVSHMFSGQDVPAMKRQMWHIVILVPSISDTPKGYPNFDIEPHVLYEFSVGKEKGWPWPFDDIARDKALQLWHGRNDGGTDIMPHLLCTGDTPYWGGVKRDGIVVACSGVQPWFDRMISGMIADMCIALAYDRWMNSSNKQQDRSFIRA